MGNEETDGRKRKWWEGCPLTCWPIVVLRPWTQGHEGSRSHNHKFTRADEGRRCGTNHQRASEQALELTIRHRSTSCWNWRKTRRRRRRWSWPRSASSAAAWTCTATDCGATARPVCTTAGCDSPAMYWGRGCARGAATRRASNHHINIQGRTSHAEVAATTAILVVHSAITAETARIVVAATVQKQSSISATTVATVAAMIMPHMTCIKTLEKTTAAVAAAAMCWQLYRVFIAW